MGKKVKPQVMQKDVARYILDELGISRPYILDFEANDTVYLFEANSVRKIDPKSLLFGMLKSIEQTSDVKVYAVTHEFFDFGNVYSFLCVSPHEEDFDGMISEVGPKAYRLYAYCWNASRQHCSEFGSVIVYGCNGRLLRVG